MSRVLKCHMWQVLKTLPLYEGLPVSIEDDWQLGRLSTRVFPCCRTDGVHCFLLYFLKFSAGRGSS